VTALRGGVTTSPLMFLKGFLITASEGGERGEEAEGERRGSGGREERKSEGGARRCGVERREGEGEL
jgi:hypothetical protein